MHSHAISVKPRACSVQDKRAEQSEPLMPRCHSMRYNGYFRNRNYFTRSRGIHDTYFTTQERKLGSFTGSEGFTMPAQPCRYDCKYVLPARCLNLPAWVACPLALKCENSKSLPAIYPRHLRKRKITGM
jgi:hypothetical protein